MQAVRADPIIRGAENWRFHSEVTDREYALSIMVTGRGDASGPFPVVYFPDADPFFAHVAAIAHQLAVEGSLPRLLIVGVGYPVGSLVEPDAYQTWLRRRTWDLFEYTRQEDWPAPMRHLEGGGAPQFLRCLTDEVIPFVEGQYPADPEGRTLLGSSASGHFAVYALLTCPTPFRRFVIGSPGRWFDHLGDLADAWLLPHGESPRQLFLSVGALEEEWQITGTRRIGDELRTRLGGRLEVISHVFEGERHYSVLPFHASRGLRAVFAE